MANAPGGRVEMQAPHAEWASLLHSIWASDSLEKKKKKIPLSRASYCTSIKQYVVVSTVVAPNRIFFLSFFH